MSKGKPKRALRPTDLPESFRPAATLAIAQGWTIQMLQNGHALWLAPQDATLDPARSLTARQPTERQRSAAPRVVTPMTPRGGRRSLQNCLSELRAAGLVFGAAGAASAARKRKVA